MNAIMWQWVVSITNRCANFNISEHLMVKKCHSITASISLKLYGPRATMKLILVCMISNLLGCDAAQIGSYRCLGRVQLKCDGTR
jgi:hypothetical protein